MTNQDLLTPVVDDGSLDPRFRLLISNRSYEPAREMLRQVWAQFPNPDRHFVREFQTTHLDARTWELYIFAVGYFGPFAVSRPTDAPDFLFERDGVGCAYIEAVTANASEKYPPLPEPQTIDDAYRQMNDEIPIRLGSPLFSKLNKKYWELPHVAGNPLVFALSDFSEDSRVRRTDSSLIRYLYGVEHHVVSLPGERVKIDYAKVASHNTGEKAIPSGFFALPGAEHVSAVVFSNEGTIPKFSRMGFDFIRHPYLRMIRVGGTVDFDPTATLPAAFAYLVGDAPEDWQHGVYVYHNPTARHPLPLAFFRGFGGQHWVHEGRHDNVFQSFAPFSSTTLMFVAKPDAAQLPVSDDDLRKKAADMARDLDEATRRQLQFLAWRNKGLSTE